MRSGSFGVCCLALTAMAGACSVDSPMGRRCASEAQCAVGGSSGNGSGGASGASGLGMVGGSSGTSGMGVESNDNALTLHVEDIEGLEIEVITLVCAGDCAEVMAVAEGGHAPYDFEWEDGSTNPTRTVCLDESAELSVSVTDTGIELEELSYDAQTARVELSAEVLDCGDEPDPPLEALCEDGATPPFQLMAETPALLSGTHPGSYVLEDYTISGLFGGGGPTVIAEATIAASIGTCEQLLIAADAAGTVAVGWDNSLLLEYRSAPGAEVERRFWFGSEGAVTYAPTGEVVEQGLLPTVPGTELLPAVPNPAPFGYEPLAIDLMDYLPQGVTRFELRLYVLDWGGFGSTTPIWAIPR